MHPPGLGPLVPRGACELRRDGRRPPAIAARRGGCVPAMAIPRALRLAAAAGSRPRTSTCWRNDLSRAVPDLVPRGRQASVLFAQPEPFTQLVPGCLVWVGWPLSCPGASLRWIHTGFCDLGRCLASRPFCSVAHRGPAGRAHDRTHLTRSPPTRSKPFRPPLPPKTF
jgi:hypothetical protein